MGQALASSGSDREVRRSAPVGEDPEAGPAEQEPIAGFFGVRRLFTVTIATIENDGSRLELLLASVARDPRQARARMGNRVSPELLRLAVTREGVDFEDPVVRSVLPQATAAMLAGLSDLPRGPLEGDRLFVVQRTGR